MLILRTVLAEFILVSYALALGVLLTASVVGCRPLQIPQPGPVPPSDGACQAAQERLEELGCPEAKTPGGTPFGEACEDAWADGRSWCPDAVAKITDCSQVEAAAAGERGDC